MCSQLQIHNISSLRARIGSLIMRTSPSFQSPRAERSHYSLSAAQPFRLHVESANLNLSASEHHRSPPHLELRDSNMLSQQLIRVICTPRVPIWISHLLNPLTSPPELTVREAKASLTQSNTPFRSPRAEKPSLTTPPSEHSRLRSERSPALRPASETAAGRLRRMPRIFKLRISVEAINTPLTRSINTLTINDDK
ncbi:hypothetical protein A8990_12415 [Paenibacillus taihuensis]|uniref:Uncharacterized protein n=1 Tax=Paenibacillus taihuensis TaxID=1156355 RepID=A0A3D9RPC0_9BACL|nr:hypothetical protein A8990_12415 [Paenibacillus taihuensis]